jgi:hypothetical protein
MKKIPLEENDDQINDRELEHEEKFIRNKKKRKSKRSIPSKKVDFNYGRLGLTQEIEDNSCTVIHPFYIPSQKYSLIQTNK